MAMTDATLWESLHKVNVMHLRVDLRSRLGQKEQLRHLRSDLESSDHLKNRSFLALVTD